MAVIPQTSKSAAGYRRGLVEADRGIYHDFTASPWTDPDTNIRLRERKEVSIK